ncbi:MAG TPA: tRNA (adenosine(37)-N6)-threonylcarbamoyltransferase complex transferase subunit TsaD [Candidatus Moranbacteria bacterium]|nr:tRNA (adenosine(37)-N6)-threonylcarbamoyltransferase complex transferase subunit TsaD [Candidatus Moranbacteria bacterium]
MKILGIETSCDETAASIIEIDEKIGYIKPLSNVISSQIKLHSSWGGVVPNLAAREHIKNIFPVIEECLKKSKTPIRDIDLMAVTRGPGLIPALLIGTTGAKTLSYVWKKPLVGIHHIEGHIYSNFINKNLNEIAFPILCLVVSGGHTQLVLMKKHLNYEVVGQTQDDAAGEAFDKVARILGLGYPGGPIISKMASEFQKEKAKYKIDFPRPMINSNDLNFSFSGLKTAVLYYVKKNESFLQDKDFVKEVCYEFQQAVLDVLIEKTIKAANIYHPKTILLAGGVSANTQLQSQLHRSVQENMPSAKFSFPELAFQLDNAGMIATAAFFRYRQENKKENFLSGWKKMDTRAALNLDTKK